MVDAFIYDDDDSAHFSAPKCVREQTPVQLHTVHYSTYPAPISLPSCERGLDSPLILHSAVVTGNALDVLAQLPTGLCHTVITSPPYWSLRDYAIPGQFGLEDDPNDYIAGLVGVFEEVRRVLSPDGAMWLNIGDSYTSGGRTWRAPDKKHPVRAMTTRPPTPQGLKPKELVGIPWRLAFALQAAGWYLRSDIVWHKPNCLSGGALVYARTQKGEMPMLVKDLVRLCPERVQLWNGMTWTQAVRWQRNPRPEAPLEIELRSGQRIGCTPDHLWPTQRGNVPADELVGGDVIQTCRLPEPMQPETPSMLPDDIGWLVGLYLAEGSRSGTCIQIAGHVKEMARFESLGAIARSYGGTCCMHRTGGNCATVNLHGKILNAVIDTYVSGHAAHNKHLSTACWRRSNAFLRAVLDGYLTGDGHFDAQNDRWRLGFTRNYALESDLRTLCARLGVYLRLALSTASCNGQEFPAFRGELRFTRSQHHNGKENGEVLRIGRSRARQFWDISVADGPYLFALASGVLTHNCMPESVKDRPTRSHEYLFLLTKSEQYYYNQDAVRRANGRNLRTVWDVNTQPLHDVHFATFPPKLVEPCVLLTSKPGGVVLDPFLGSGTVAMVAIQGGRAFLGIELNSAYVAIARRRIAETSRLDQQVEQVG